MYTLKGIFGQDLNQKRKIEQQKAFQFCCLIEIWMHPSELNSPFSVETDKEGDTKWMQRMMTNDNIYLIKKNFKHLRISFIQNPSYSRRWGWWCDDEVSRPPEKGNMKKNKRAVKNHSNSNSSQNRKFHFVNQINDRHLISLVTIFTLFNLIIIPIIITHSAFHEQTPFTLTMKIHVVFSSNNLIQ